MSIREPLLRTEMADLGASSCTRHLVAGSGRDGLAL